MIVLAATWVISTAHVITFTFLAPYAGGRLDVRGVGFAVLLLEYGAEAVAASSVSGPIVDRRPQCSAREPQAGSTPQTDCSGDQTLTASGSRSRSCGRGCQPVYRLWQLHPL
ncbi:hypothetical protein [Dactylosporangium matsuzakiense]|uniref:hypothetical protein n=1 Tax=Dactylosporangium matsuzakiense TaxID=53360 RepID=UPI0022F2B69F|nr:hypothetical protein [Dactylosporangium matsuzakiense]